MKQKNSGFTASGPARPEIHPGDIFRDNYGGTVTIKHVAGRCVTYRRDGYGYDCVMPVYQFRRDFSLICVFRSIRSRIGIEVRSAIRIHSINRELNFFYRFLTRFFAAFH
ncbi:DUF4222 domain-containing protein, partial [Escherichia coli]|uniref:DUF4222 domain-containing protein n=1 Tax=Escherichia coli TaxID=562 RepID=UPI0038558FA1